MVILSSIELSFYPKEGGNMAFSIDPAFQPETSQQS